MTTNIDISNRALAEIGTRSQITSFNPATDASQEAAYCNLLYNPFRDFLLRNGDYEFALRSALTVVAGGSPFPWTFSYTYPADCVRVKQLIPLNVNLLDPYPAEFSILGQGGSRVIATNVASERVVYSSNGDSEDMWDSMFSESMVRFLGSGLMFALENGGNPSARLLNDALQFAEIASQRNG